MKIEITLEELIKQNPSLIEQIKEMGNDWSCKQIKQFTINKLTSFNMIYIEPGKFMMGSPSGEPGRFSNETQHEVVLTQGFYMAETACTQELWEAVMGDNPSAFEGLQNPVDSVSWEDAIKFIEKLNRITGQSFRLPTEAEWEYSCRAGTDTPFSFGGYGGEEGEYRERTVPVKTFPCNHWGLHGMHGNVGEMCSDWIGNYPEGCVVDPVGPSTGSCRVIRGGSWCNDGRNVRSAYRLCNRPDKRSSFYGFRLVLG